MSGARAAFPCPRSGCTELAVAAPDEGVLTPVGAYLWECPAGHHGPRLVLNLRIRVD